MSKVLVNGLSVRAGPSTSSQKVAHYDKGDVINSGKLLVEGDGRIWLKYTGGSGNDRYVCAINNDNSLYVDVPASIPGPRKIEGNTSGSGWTLTAYCSCASCCGKSDGITASGYHLTVRVEDRGGDINGKRLDIFCRNHQEANQFGRKHNCNISY